MRGSHRLKILGGFGILGLCVGCGSSPDPTGGAGAAAPTPAAAPAAEPAAPAEPAANEPEAAPPTYASAPLLAKQAMPGEPIFDYDGPVTLSRFGRLSGPMGVVDEGAARAFLAGSSAELGITSVLQDIALERPAESPIGEHFFFRQTVDGVPVEGAEVCVHFNRQGEVIGAQSSYVDGIALPTVVPAIPPELAIDLVRAALPAGETVADEGAGDPEAATPAPTSELVVYTGSRGAALAWRVGVPTDGPSWVATIDATDGTLLREPRDVNRYVDGKARVFLVNPVVALSDGSLRDQRDTAGAVPLAAYEEVDLLGLDGNGRLDGPFASTSATKKRVFNAQNMFMYDRSSVGFSEAEAYYAVDYAQRYIQSLGFTTVNNRRQVMNVAAGNKDNSFYSGLTTNLSFGQGGVDDAEDAEVVWHEYGHSIQDNQKPGFGASHEAGSMGEGFGDYWAGSVGAQLSEGVFDLTLMEWDATAFSKENPPFLRRLDSDKTYIDFAHLEGEVHADGEIWSAALWQIRTKIGSLKADKVILQAHFFVNPSGSFNEGANKIVFSAKNLVGFTAEDVQDIRDILGDRGFTITE